MFIFQTKLRFGDGVNGLTFRLSCVVYGSSRLQKLVNFCGIPNEFSVLGYEKRDGITEVIFKLY